MKKLNKRELVDLVAENCHLSRREARDTVDTVFDLIEDALLKGMEVNITNFGVLEPKVRKERQGTDPKTHKLITLKETQTISFKPAKCMKEKMN